MLNYLASTSWQIDYALAQFQYIEQEGMYTEFLDKSTDNVFLTSNRDHGFLLNHKDNVSNISNNSNEPKKSSFAEKSINFMQITSPVLSDLLCLEQRYIRRAFSYIKNGIKTLCKRYQFHGPSSTEKTTWRPHE